MPDDVAPLVRGDFMTDAGVLIAAAVEHHRAGRFAEAARLYRACLVVVPEQADAAHLLGLAFNQQGMAAAGVPWIARALALAGPAAPFEVSLGMTLFAAGRVDAAAAAFERALALAPDNVEAMSGLASARRGQGRLDEAIAGFEAVLRRQPGHGVARYNLANALQAADRVDEAIAAYELAAAALPGRAEVLNNHGVALKTLGRLAESIAVLDRAAAMAPGNGETFNNLGIALQLQGRQEEAISAFRRSVDLRPDFAAAHSNLIFALHYDADTGENALFAECRRWSMRHGAATRRLARPHGPARDPEKRLRIGYLSADFRDGPIANNILGLYQHHDRARFELLSYAQLGRQDAVTRRFRDQSDVWRPINALDDAAVAEQVRADGVDVLVSVAGHTAGNRLGPCAAHPAPVQVSFADLGTSGLDEIDWWLTDERVHPEGAVSEQFTERLWRLPLVMMFVPRPDAPDVAPPPSGETGIVTFGSCNNPAKIGAATVRLWARVLRAVPNSRLLLKYLNICEDPGLQARYRGLFASEGIAAERLVFAPGTPPGRQHLDVLGRIDVALDPFPFNGCNTTFEALWMGVPVVTLAGRRWLGRMGTTFLGVVGLGELVAATEDAYVAIAAGLAADHGRLARLRATLRPRVAASPLCDSAAYTRSFEDAFRAMWRLRCAAAT
jgi:predicted O-linked N-acetylglucosamine transferase (SPINDLY family)